MTRKEVCDSMTLQDAIQVFRDTNAYGTMDLAKTVILEALEQKTSDDCISRKAVMDIDFNRICATCAKPNEMIRQKIAEIPSVAPQSKTEQHPCELLILKTRLLLRKNDLKEWEENIKRGKEEGLIILPSYFEPILVPNDVEIRIEQEPQPKTESEGKQ